MREYSDIIPGDLVIAEYDDCQLVELYVSISKHVSSRAIGRVDIVTIEHRRGHVQPIRFSRDLSFAIRDDYGGDAVPLFLIRAGVIYEVAPRRS